MPVAIRRALEEANMPLQDIHGIAYTRGPGMAGCLAVGANAGRGIAAALNKPIVGVHHMQAHALTPILTTPEPPQFPYLTLLVSGGHTMLVIAYSPTKFRILATTVDSSIGQAIDSVARLLKLSWHDSTGELIGPGAALEALAASSPPPSSPSSSVVIPDFPIAFQHHLSFSFAGPKGEVNRFLHKLPEGALDEDQALRIAVASKFQSAVVAQVEEKVRLAFKWCSLRGIDVTSLVASGGVASNQYLRQRLGSVLEEISCVEDRTIPLICPPPHLCTDNAAMIGWASMHRFVAGDHDSFDIGLRSTWPLDDLDVKPL